MRRIVRNRTVRVSQKVRALLGENEVREFATIDGAIYCTEDRHYLHRLLGKLNEPLLRFLTAYPISQKELQETISAQQCEPLVALGFLEYASEVTSSVVEQQNVILRVVVGKTGTMESIIVTDSSTNRVASVPVPVACKKMKVEDFIWHAVGEFYKKGA